MRFDNTKIRCSAIGNLMTEPKSKAAKDAGELSEGAKSYCVDLWVQERYGRSNDITSRYMEKGLMVEEDAITLYSRIKKNFFKKNMDTVMNAYLSGTPDLYIGKDILAADEVQDVKSSWDLFTFSRVRTSSLNRIYFYQLQGYMALTGAKSAKLAYCLIDTPDVLINDEKRKLLWKMGVVSEEDSSYVEACEELDRSMRFGDIPMDERMIEFTIDRDEDVIDQMYIEVIAARAFMNELDKKVGIKPLQPVI
jgi:hypothetical protein